MAKRETAAEKKRRQAAERKRIREDFKRLNKMAKPDPDDSTGDFRATGRALGRFRQEQRTRNKETAAEKAKRQAEERKKILADFKRLNKEKPFNTKELDIGSDRETKTIGERAKDIASLSEEGKKELIYDMSKKGLKLTNSERRRRGLPTLGTGKKSGGKVYSRGSRKAKYNG